MSSPTSKLALGVAALGGVLAVACSDSSTAPSSTAAASVTTSLLSTAFSSTAPGYDQLASSFNASGNTGSFGPGGGHGDHGGRGGPGFGDLMGGGLGGDFLGGGGFGPGFGRGAFGDPRGGAPLSTCTFTASDGRVTCAPVTFNGLTTTRYAIYTNAAGAAQQAFDTTTNTAVTHVEVSGTTTFTPGNRRGFGHGFGPDSAHVGVASATSTVSSTSDRTVMGLAAGSAQRTVNGTSAGRESSSGKLSDSTTFTATRVMGDTTTGLVVPIKTGRGVYPTAGTVIRASAASVAVSGGAPTTTTRREVITYDGSATAKVTIVQNDTTRTCTMPLPRGRLSCS